MSRFPPAGRCSRAGRPGSFLAEVVRTFRRMRAADDREQRDKTPRTERADDKRPEAAERPSSDRGDRERETSEQAAGRERR